MTVALLTATRRLALGHRAEPVDEPRTQGTLVVLCDRCTPRPAGNIVAAIELDVPPTIRGQGLPRVLNGPGRRVAYCPECLEELVALGTAIDTSRATRANVQHQPPTKGDT